MRFDQTKLPHQMKDEDKWFHLTKSQLLRMIIVTVVAALIVKAAIALNITIVGVALAIIIEVVALIVVVATVPESMYLYGTDRPAYVPVLFFLRKKIKKSAKIYVGNKVRK